MSSIANVGPICSSSCYPAARQILLDNMYKNGPGCAEVRAFALGTTLACSEASCPAFMQQAFGEALPLSNQISDLNPVVAAGVSQYIDGIEGSLSTICNSTCLNAGFASGSTIARISANIGILSPYTANAEEEAYIDAEVAGTFQKGMKVFELMCAKDPATGSYCAAELAGSIGTFANLPTDNMTATISAVADASCSYCGAQFFSLSPVVNALSSNISAGGGNVNQIFPLLCSRDASGKSCAAVLANIANDPTFATAFILALTPCVSVLTGGQCTDQCRNSLNNFINTYGCCFTDLLSSFAGDGGISSGAILNGFQACGIYSSLSCESKTYGVLSFRMPALNYEWIASNTTLKQMVMDAIAMDLAEATGTGATYFNVQSLASGSLIANVQVRGSSNMLTKATFDAASRSSQTGALAFNNVASTIIGTGATPQQYSTDPNTPATVMFAADQQYAINSGTVVVPQLGDGASALALAGAAILAALGAFVAVLF